MAVTILHCSDTLRKRRERINRCHSLTRHGASIIVLYAGSSGARRADIRDNRWGVDSRRLCNYAVAHFTTSGNVSAPLGERPGTGQPGTDSRRYDDGCGVAGLGHAGPKDSRQHGRSSHRNVALFTLSNTSQLRRPLLLRTIRLVLYPAKVPLCLQRGHFFQRQSCLLSIRAATAAAVSHAARYFDASCS
jgi:hypothetical protein